MTTPTNFHNTTKLTGDELRDKDLIAQSQEEKLFWIMRHLKNQVEWWTRDALNREYERRFGKRLKDQSISRALSNLSSWFCTSCRKYFSGGECKCGRRLELGATWNQPKTQKSDTAMWRSDEGDRVHAWRIAPDPGQGDLFGDSVVNKGAFGGMQ